VGENMEEEQTTMLYLVEPCFEDLATRRTLPVAIHLKQEPFMEELIGSG